MFDDVNICKTKVHTNILWEKRLPMNFDGSYPLIFAALLGSHLNRWFLRGHFQLARARLRRGRCLEAREALKLGLNRYPQDRLCLNMDGNLGGMQLQ